MPKINITGQGSPESTDAGAPAPDIFAPNLTPKQIRAATAAANAAKSLAKAQANFFKGIGTDTNAAMKSMLAAAQAQEQAAKKAVVAQKKLFEGVGKNTAATMKSAFAQGEADVKAAKARDAVEAAAAKKVDAARKQLFAGLGTRTTTGMKSAFAQGEADAKAVKARDKVEAAATKKAADEQKKLFEGIGARTNTGMKSAFAQGEAEAKSAKTRNTAEAAAAKKEDEERKKLFAGIGTRTITAMKAAKAVGDAEAAAEKKKQAAADKEARAAQTAKGAKSQGLVRAAGVTAMVAAGLNGDIEGLAAGIGEGIGAVIAGPVGAAIGVVAGEILGKVAKLAATAPMKPGEMWQSYLSVSKPWMDLQRSGYAMARAGKFSGDEALDSVLPPGSFGTKAPEWMKLTGSTPESVMQSINATGINPRNQGEFNAMGQTLAYAGNTGAYSNLPDGMKEKALGQGMNYGATSAGGSAAYLGSFAGVLEGAVARGVDKGRVFSSMLESIDALVKNGAAGVSGSAVSDEFMRFMATGTAGGRSGESAMQSMAGTSSMIGGMLNSAPGMYGFMRVAQKYGGLNTPEQIKSFLGPNALASFQGDPGFANSLIQQAAAAGSLPEKQSILAPLMQADTGNYQNQVADTVGDQLGGAGDFVGASMLGISPQLYRARQYGRTHGTTAPTDYNDQMLHQRVAGGTGSDADMVKALTELGVPNDQIPALLAAAKAQGVDPIKLALIARKETGFRMIKGDIAISPGVYAQGIMQINPNAHTLGKDIPANAYTDMAANYMGGAAIFKATDQNFAKYNGSGPKADAYGNDLTQQYNQFRGSNVPVQANTATAMGAQAVDTGSKAMFTNMNGLIKTVSTTAESAAGAVRKFADALDGMKTMDVNVKGPSAAQQNWDASGGSTAAAPRLRPSSFHAAQ